VATKVLSSAQGGSATLTCDDGNGNIVFTKDIEHSGSGAPFSGFQK
jgi:hypothetical protein